MGLLNDFSPGGSAINLASDTTFPNEVGVYVGTGGTVKIDTTETTALVVVASAGMVLPWAVRKVYSTANGTTAADLVSVKLP
jgi:hypothetical protein